MACWCVALARMLSSAERQMRVLMVKLRVCSGRLVMYVSAECMMIEHRLEK